MSIRVRIAPSPTGNLHIGTARAALFNYLYAKRYDGKFILRIEDTDLERSDKKYEENIFQGLEWLGIEWDEGPIAFAQNQKSKIKNQKYNGDYGPYRQSERIATYKKYIGQLLADGKAFYCFHSEEELEKEREGLMGMKRPPVHLCEYREMNPEEAGMLTEAKSDYIIRFKTPAGRKIEFHDLIRGDLSFESDLIGDFSIAKRVDVPLYNFAVVVDDHEMKISHVIRGEDHISNTPKQILLAEALGFPLPQFAHLPLILGQDRSKMSKRHGATSVSEYREAGYLPEAFLNFMALLGWNPGDDREIFSKEELIREFSIEKVQKSGAVFDVKKLDWMNGEYIRQKSVKELTTLCVPFLEKVGLRQAQAISPERSRGTTKKRDDYLEKIIALEQPRLKKLSEIGERVDYFFREPEYDKELLRWKDMTDIEISKSLHESIAILKKYDGALTKEKLESAFLAAIGDGDKGRLLWPLRVALSGKKASPGPFEIMEVLGVEKSLRRIHNTAKKLM